MASPWQIVRFGTICTLFIISSPPAVASTTSNYTASEIEFGHSLDWCIGDEAHPIQWIEKDEIAIDAKIAAGARPAPVRDAKGRISHLDGFVNDRLSTLPPEAIMDNLPTIIIENECASVSRGDEKCVFDYAATPAPFQWAPSEYAASIFHTKKIPPSIQNWGRDDLTVVYVPESVSSEGAKELTRMASPEPKLAKLHTRGNSSRKNPKKQFSLKLPKSETLIPGGSNAKKWVLSAYSADKSYIDNKFVFDMYRRFGELQRELSDSWPKEGSIEDKSTIAFSPRSQMVNLIFQGRYAGIFYLMDRVEAGEGRVWLPEASHDNEHESKQIDGIKLPKGSYLLSRDWTNKFKTVLNPDRALELEDDGEHLDPGLLVPNFHNWTGAVLGEVFRLFFNASGVTTPMEWTIMSPKTKSFLDSESDEDIFLLKGFLLQLHTWLKDPIGNNDILANVIDMTSMARWFLLQEFAKEHDGYVASMYFKVVGGKLYHASPWDYAGTSFWARPCNSPYALNPLTVNRETNTYSTRSPCNEATGNMATAGWWVNSIYNLFEESVCTMLSGEMGEKYGVDCSEGKSTLSDMKWFFGNIFRVPSLQVEFWKLCDIVVEHGLVENSSSDTGDLFSADLFSDEIFEPIRNTVEADRRIWSATLQEKNVSASFDTSIIHPDTCEPLLEESLRRSNAGNTPILDPFTIPRKNWAFQTAHKNGEFINFYKGLVAKEPIDFISNFVDSDYVFVNKKKYFKYRLEWIMSQHPGTEHVDTSQTTLSLPDSEERHSVTTTVTIAAIASAVLILSAKWFWKNDRSNYSTIGNVELE